LAEQFDKQTCTWHSLGQGGEALLKESEREIVSVLEENVRSQATTLARLPGTDYSNTHKRVDALRNAWKIRKDVVEGRPNYYLPLEIEMNEVHTHPTQPTHRTQYPFNGYMGM
jgi:hypothetical protein